MPSGLGGLLQALAGRGGDEGPSMPILSMMRPLTKMAVAKPHKIGVNMRVRLMREARDHVKRNAENEEIRSKYGEPGHLDEDIQSLDKYVEASEKLEKAKTFDEVCDVIAETWDASSFYDVTYRYRTSKYIRKAFRNAVYRRVWDMAVDRVQEKRDAVANVKSDDVKTDDE